MNFQQQFFVGVRVYVRVCVGSMLKAGSVLLTDRCIDFSVCSQRAFFITSLAYSCFFKLIMVHAVLETFC